MYFFWYNRPHINGGFIVKAVKDINKMILIKGIEIMLTIGFMFLATNLYNNGKTQEVLHSIMAFQNVRHTTLNVQNQIDYMMFPMTNEKAMEKLVPCTLLVHNDTYQKENYTLVLKVNKTSMTDLSSLNISVDNSIYSLNDLENETINGETIFILDRNTIAGESKEYDVRVWLNTSASNIQTNNLTLHFELLNETTNL